MNAVSRPVSAADVGRLLAGDVCRLQAGDVGRLQAGDIERLQALCIFIACNVICYGIHVALFCSAISVLARRSKLGTFLPAVTATIFVLSTAWLASTFHYTLLRVPTAPTPAILSLMTALNKTDLTLSRVSCILSDLIVVWRAWALWPDNRVVKALLVLCMAGTVGGTIGDIVLVHIGGMSRSARMARLLLSILPILLTNIVATAAVWGKVWEYRRTIKDQLAQPTPHTQIERVLLLMVESGAGYVGVWIAFLIVCLADLPAAFGAGSPVSAAYLMGSVIPSLSGIYPTAIIIVTALQRSSPEGSIGTTDLRALGMTDLVDTIEFSAREGFSVRERRS